MSQETFAFDPAHNIIEREGQKQQDNKVNQYHGTHYRYDGLGNLVERKLASGETQYYRYDLNDQLIEAKIIKANGREDVWHYRYDPLGRRLSKRSVTHENLQTDFVWDGSHLIQEQSGENRYTYIYTHPESYEPLAQIQVVKNGDKQTAYYHCDQIEIPRELTNEKGELCWYASYKGWGELQGEHNLKGVHQPLRLQNQYFDKETGLHYNFFRYYEPNVGRFTTQDPIGLAGGENLYRFADNTQGWIDPLGNIAFVPIFWAMVAGASSGAAIDAGTQIYSNVKNDKEWNDLNYSDITTSAGLGAVGGPIAGKVAKIGVSKYRAKNFFNKTHYSDKVKKQASSSDYHSFPQSVDGFARSGNVTKIRGGDGKLREKLEIKGGYDNKRGTFEYIKEPNGMINHRLFKPEKIKGCLNE